MSRGPLTADERAEVRRHYERNGALLERLCSLIDAGGGETDAWRNAREELGDNMERIRTILDLTGSRSR